MNDFISLPFDFSGLLISTWLSISEVTWLDSAVCTKNHRPALLQLLTSDFVIHENRSQDRANPRLFIKWLVLRQVKLLRIVISEEIDYLFFEGEPPIFWNHLKSIESVKGSQGSNCWQMSSTYVKVFMHCPNVESLDLSFCNLSDSILQVILQGCPRVKHLKLSSSESSRDEACAAVLMQHCPELVSLELTAHNFHINTLTALVQSKPLLESVILRYYYSIFEESLSPEVMALFSRLRSIAFVHCYERNSIVRFAEHCPLLESISLENNLCVGDAKMKDMAQYCPNLRPSHLLR